MMISGYEERIKEMFTSIRYVFTYSVAQIVVSIVGSDILQTGIS